MAKKYESDRHIEDVMQTEISAAIRYLDPDLKSANGQEGYGAGVAICVALLVLVLGGLIFMWLYP